MIRQSGGAPVLWIGNFLLAFVLLGGCMEVDEQSSSYPSVQEKKEQKKALDKQGISQEIEPVEENAVSGMDMGWKTTEISEEVLRQRLLLRLQEEHWEMVTLQLKEADEIDMPSDDFMEPHITHAVLEKQDYSMDYAWVEINQINKKFNEIWKKHWGKITDESEDLEEGSLAVHLTSIQRRYESLLNQIRHMEFKNSTEYAQHLHNYKLYVEGAVLYRKEAASTLLEALDNEQQANQAVEKAVEAAVNSEGYASLSDSELTSYQQGFLKDPDWNSE